MTCLTLSELSTTLCRFVKVRQDPAVKQRRNRGGPGDHVRRAHSRLDVPTFRGTKSHQRFRASGHRPTSTQRALSCCTKSSGESTPCNAASPTERALLIHTLHDRHFSATQLHTSYLLSGLLLRLLLIVVARLAQHCLRPRCRCTHQPEGHERHASLT